LPNDYRRDRLSKEAEPSPRGDAAPADAAIKSEGLDDSFAGQMTKASAVQTSEAQPY